MSLKMGWITEIVPLVNRPGVAAKPVEVVEPAGYTGEWIRTVEDGRVLRRAGKVYATRLEALREAILAVVAGMRQ